MQDLNKQAQRDIQKYNQAPKTEQVKEFIRLLRGVMGGGENILTPAINVTTKQQKMIPPL
jgi:uncharacterized protein with von Willebrand factor type A (vWA) domain